MDAASDEHTLGYGLGKLTFGLPEGRLVRRLLPLTPPPPAPPLRELAAAKRTDNGWQPEDPNDERTQAVWRRPLPQEACS